MTALHDFIRASASYFGLPLDQLTVGSTLDTSNGDMEVVLRVALLPSDVAEIAQRMERMALEARVDAQVAERNAQAEAAKVPSRDVLRAMYNSLSEADQSRYGSFHNYVQAQGFPDPYPAMRDTLPGPSEEPVTIPTVVWLERGEATAYQAQGCAIGVDAQGRIGVAPEDLTPDQKAARGL
jgi:hypothetical protein